MAIDSMSAARAYADTANMLAKSPSGPEKAGAANGFGAVLSQGLSAVSDAAQTTEIAATQTAMGRADLVDVVTAVAAAEATLETVVSVRDQVIKAYQEIMRMPV